MPKIMAYHRPSTIEEALRLLGRSGVHTAIVGGGTYITAHLDETVDEVVDLQALKLSNINLTGDRLTLGAMVRLQTIVDDNRIPLWLREATHREGPNTFRHAATIGGVVVGANKESELLAMLLVSEAEVHLQAKRGSQHLALADFLKNVPAALAGGLVTAVSMASSGQAASARVGRTPADAPIVAAAARQDANNKLHLALCGMAATPILVNPDQIAALTPEGDFRGSAEYRRQMALTLAQRVINQVTGK